MFQRFGNMSGLFQVMASAVRALEKRDVDPPFMAKLAKIATAEMISSKVHQNPKLYRYHFEQLKKHFQVNQYGNTSS